MTDLVEKAQRGDKEAFIRLIERNQQALYKIAVSILRNDADTADAIQDTILSCYENLGKLKQPQFFRTWMTRVLINHCRKILKSHSKLVPIESYPEFGLETDNTFAWEIQEMLMRLDENYRIVLVLYYVEEFSVKEIGTILELNENTVKTRLARGRKYFREIYQKENPSAVYEMEAHQYEKIRG